MLNLFTYNNKNKQEDKMNNTYDSEYEIQKEILKELGGTDKCYDSPFPYS